MRHEGDAVRLRHVIDAAEKAVTFVAGRSRSDLSSDEMLGLALVRLLEVIGEAAKNVSESTRAEYPNVQWRAIASTRDRLIHGYFDVDMDVVWGIVTEDLPRLLAQLRQ